MKEDGNPIGRAVARRLPRYLPSLVVFVGGTAGLVVADAVIARLGTAVEVEAWVALKALVMLAGAIALGGLEQIILREPYHAPRLARWAAINLTAVAAVTAAGAYFLNFYRIPSAAFLAIFGFGASAIAASFLRSRLHLFSAQTARDGWKLLLLFAVWPVWHVAGLPLQWLLVLSLAAAIAIAVSLPRGAGDRPLVQHQHDARSYAGAMRAGFPFLMSATGLAVGSYGELFLIRTFGTPEVIHGYFQAVILFAYPSVMLNAFVGHMLGPEIRQSPAAASAFMRRSRAWLAAAAIGIPVAVLIFGRVAEAVAFPDNHAPWWLALLLSATGGLRIAYIPASLFIGILGDGDQLRRIMSRYFVAALATLPVCAGLVAAGVPVAAAVALTGLAHWLFRAAIGWTMTARIIDDHAR